MQAGLSPSDTFLCIDNNVTHLHAQHKSADFTEASMMSSLPRGPPRIQAIFVIDSKKPCMSHAIHRNLSYFTPAIYECNKWKVALESILLNWTAAVARAPPSAAPHPHSPAPHLIHHFMSPCLCQELGQRPGVCPPGTHHPWRAGLQVIFILCTEG